METDCLECYGTGRFKMDANSEVLCIKCNSTGKIKQMENKSLYLIEKEYLELNERIMNEEGVITDEIWETLAINKGDLEKKAQGYGFVIKKNEAELLIIENEIARLIAHKKAREKSIEAMKEAVTEAMKMYGIDKIESPLMKLSLRKSQSVEVEDIEKLPSNFVRTVISKSAMKSEIKDAMKAGIEIAGAKLITNQNLQLK